MGYDYGSFSKAAPRLLKPLVEELQFKQVKGTAFARERAQWVDGFFLQQSAYGSGDFCVNVGIDVPALDDLRGTLAADRSFGLLVYTRLGDDGVDDEAWLPASDKAELQASITTVQSWLPALNAWFNRFQSFGDIVAEYERRNDLTCIKEDEHLSTLAITNYGLLLQLAGSVSEARSWLEIARAQWQFTVSEDLKQFAKRKPGKEALSFHQQNLDRLHEIEAILDRIS